MVLGLLLLGLEPVRENSSTRGRLGGVLALNLNSHALVLLQVAGKVGLFGGLGGLGDVEDLDLAIGVGLLDGGGLVGLELLKIKLLDEVGCDGNVSARAPHYGMIVAVCVQGMVWCLSSSPSSSFM